MWNLSAKKIKIRYYFNHENINLLEIHEYLNNIAVNSGLSRKGWMLLFKINKCKVEE